MITHSRPDISDSERTSVVDVLSGGQLIHGVLTEEFERRCSEYLGHERAFAVNSGTTALVAALISLNLPGKSEIIISAYQCGDVSEAVLAAGHVPVPCDIGSRWCMTAGSAACVLGRRTGAIIVTSVFGISVPVGLFRAFGLPIIVDACQRFYPEAPEDRGDVAVYSFHATKCLTTGEGGLVAASDAGRVAALVSLASIPNSPMRRGFNDLQASLGLAQLNRYPIFLQRRQRIAEAYLAALPASAIASTREIARDTMWYRFPTSSDADFESVAAAFERRGIAVRRGVDALIEGGNAVPQATERLRTTVSLPIYPALSDEDVARIIDAAGDLLG